MAGGAAGRVGRRRPRQGRVCLAPRREVGDAVGRWARSPLDAPAALLSAPPGTRRGCASDGDAPAPARGAAPPAPAAAQTAGPRRIGVPLGPHRQPRRRGARRARHTPPAPTWTRGWCLPLPPAGSVPPPRVPCPPPRRTHAADGVPRGRGPSRGAPPRGGHAGPAAVARGGGASGARAAAGARRARAAGAPAPRRLRAGAPRAGAPPTEAGPRRGGGPASSGRAPPDAAPPGARAAEESSPTRTVGGDRGRVRHRPPPPPGGHFGGQDRIF